MLFAAAASRPPPASRSLVRGGATTLLPRDNAERGGHRARRRCAARPLVTYPSHRRSGAISGGGIWPDLLQRGIR
jgi:hypothetical protein